MRTLAVAAAALLVGIPTHAATITVDVAGSGDFLTIQAGLDAGSPGDTILVLPGVYTGHANSDLSFGGKDMTLRSDQGRAVTTINPSDLHSAFYVHEGETRDAVIDGFTVADGVNYTSPGFYCHNASPTIQNCRFTNCYGYGDHHTEGYSAAGTFYGSSGALVDCIIDDNYANNLCGGVGIISSSVEIENCVFTRNDDGWEGVGALYIRNSGGTSITGCLFSENLGTRSCISVSDSYPMTVTNCTFVDNGSVSSSPPVGRLIGSAGPAPISVTYSLFAFNRVEKIVNEDDDVMIAWCGVYGNACGDTLEGNYEPSRIIWDDPLFCDMDADDYSLCANSPCLPSVSGWTERVGAYDAGCDNCSSAVQELTWGRIKALYR